MWDLCEGLQLNRINAVKPAVQLQTGHSRNFPASVGETRDISLQCLGALNRKAALCLYRLFAVLLCVISQQVHSLY